MGAVAGAPDVVLRFLQLGVFLALGAAAVMSPAAQCSRVRHYHFLIKKVNVTRLCRQKSILTVNGQFPGPTIRARTGDVVVVNVHNHGDKNITIHWHGVDQPRNPWSDGPEYVTQCPIQPGAAFAYRVILSQEEGTLWWHAHTGFDRATVHGAIVILPKHGDTFPFQTKPPVEEMPPIILGELWRDDDATQLLEDAVRTGRDVKPSDANTINGEPGGLFPCSNPGTFRVRVERGKTYLLRVINAGLSNDMFFAVAGHRLTVVATDARYTKPFATDHLMVASGQTVDALLHANRTAGGGGYYYMAARTFSSDTNIDFNNSTATAIVEYADATASGRLAPAPVFPATLPAVDDTAAAAAYTARLRSLASKAHPVDVPAHADERMFMTMAVNLIACAPNENCTGPHGDHLAATLNNVSFQNPSAVDILRAYYYGGSGHGVYDADFPDRPPSFFNFTDPGIPASGLVGPFTERGTRVKVLEHGAAVEVVFQDTAVLGTESHPMHLHGYSFYVVGRGLGNFDEGRDPAGYNLVDPPLENTVAVPKGGWAAIRFRATNPGVWFMHCHFDRHVVWGMDTVFIVKDGKAPEAKMMRPPPNMPKC
ncbi:putative laccase-9 [Dichanthelium oligosanthes]|uniref:Laccase n=1 Tax=Dichanthelium oligosanthes TaxID=888268 RepID=A0A1E5WIT3_9POAL|nr:putative laccase-9 [Dichanthelium oligosanthes]